MRSFVLLFSIGIAACLVVDFCTACVTQIPAMTSPEFCVGMRPQSCPRDFDPQCTEDGSQYSNICKLCGAIQSGEQPEDVYYESCQEI